MPTNRVKPFFQRPSGTNITPDLAAWMDQVQNNINALIGTQAPTTPSGLQTITPNDVNPASSQIVSEGARAGSLATAFIYVADSTGSLSFYWDGTNGSTLLSIYRDDGTIEPPLSGSLTITGLTAGTKYFLYPFFQEVTGISNNFGNQLPGVNWGIDPGVGVGTPAIAFTSPNLAAAQQQLSRDHIPLAVGCATDGITIPLSGTTTGSTGGGGGGSGIYLASTFT